MYRRRFQGHSFTRPSVYNARLGNTLNLYKHLLHKILKSGHIFGTLYGSGASPLSGVYTSNVLNNLEFYSGQILSLYEAKMLGKYLTQIFSFINVGQNWAQIKIQII